MYHSATSTKSQMLSCDIYADDITLLYKRYIYWAVAVSICFVLGVIAGSLCVSITDLSRQHKFQLLSLSKQPPVTVDLCHVHCIKSRS